MITVKAAIDEESKLDAIIPKTIPAIDTPIDKTPKKFKTVGKECCMFFLANQYTKNLAVITTNNIANTISMTISKTPPMS